MRKYGAFEVTDAVGPVFERVVPAEELSGAVEAAFGRVYTPVPAEPGPNIVPMARPTPTPTAAARSG